MSYQCSLIQNQQETNLIVILSVPLSYGVTFLIWHISLTLKLSAEFPVVQLSEAAFEVGYWLVRGNHL